MGIMHNMTLNSGFHWARASSELISVPQAVVFDTTADLSKDNIRRYLKMRSRVAVEKLSRVAVQRSRVAVKN